MSRSLQDQLKRSGLVSDQQVRDHRAKQRKARKQGAAASEVTEEARAAAARAAAEKAERDRALARERASEAEARERTAQARQLIERHRLALPDGEEAYNFVDGTVVRRLLVGVKTRDALAAGRLVVVRDGEGYAVVPTDVGERIAAREPGAIVHAASGGDDADGGDEYAGYEVPDDLRW
ncbi:MAG: DUF2058 domain-containing protein [Ectothiorhodospiraceae bacterium]|nr:DUF2058 domain-containing protein [Ectothiorhodospiraceae bacterium]